MAITIKRKENEPLSSFLYRASRRIQKSGILVQTRRTRFHAKGQSRHSKWQSAMNRIRMEREIQRFLKQGFTLEEAVDRARKILKDIIKK
ncbi:MAG: 30S ribosomal protein S21 [Parcubacteria group bacterium]|nr:30S ribosomal protein S21 [Parcubacteria group bacterium]